MGEKGVSSLSLSKAKTKDHVLFKPHDKKHQYPEQCLGFFTHLVSLSRDEPLWKEPAGFCTVRTSVSCVADSEYRLFSLFAFHNVNCHWMGGGWGGKPLLLYMNMCTVCVQACHSLLLINLSNCNRTINICFYKYTGCSVSVYDFTAHERKYCTVININ